MSNLRTFIAVDLPQEVVQRAVKLSRQLGQVAEGINWVEPENMHLTLKFLGEIRENETYKICQAIDRAVAEFTGFEIEFHGAGAFPKLERPRSIWIGVRQGSDELCQLQAAIDDAMADLGFAHEPKRFLPHLTIGRVKKPGPWVSELSRAIADQAEFEAQRATVGEVVLYSSELGSEGPIYSPIGRTTLR